MTTIGSFGNNWIVWKIELFPFHLDRLEINSALTFDSSQKHAETLSLGHPLSV